MRRVVLCLGLSCGLLAAPFLANAQLTNGGFETGDLTGWTAFGAGFDGVFQGGPNLGTADPPPEGQWCASKAVLGGNTADKDGGIYQRVAWNAVGAYARARFTNCVESNEGVAVRIGIDPTGGTNPDAASVVWSCPTGTRNNFGQGPNESPDPIRRVWSEVGVQLTGITPGGFITVFIDSELNLPRPGGNSGWKILAIDDVRLTPLAPAPLPTNLDFPNGTLLGWSSRRPPTVPDVNVPGNPANAMLTGPIKVDTGHDKGGRSGPYYWENIESYASDKDSLLAQRFTTNPGSGQANQIRVSVDVNTGGTFPSGTNARIRLGVDPTGNTNPAAGTVTWSEFVSSNTWTTFEGGTSPTVTVSGLGGACTIFIERWHLYPENWVRSAFDNIRVWYDGVEYIESQQPTPTPTNTLAPTNTPTNTPVPPANDIDGDLIDDSLEHGNVVGSPKTSFWLDDSDGDGLLDGQEDANRNGNLDAGETNPRMRDTDGDGIEDGVEVKSSQPSNPLSNTSPATFVDADADGLGAVDDPNDNNPDSDGDRFNDRYEFVKLNLAAVTNANVKPKLGDLNGDNAVSNVDALITQSLFLGNITPASPILHPGGIVVGTHIYGDPNRDGFVSNVDALIIQSFFLGNLARLPL